MTKQNRWLIIIIILLLFTGLFSFLFSKYKKKSLIQTPSIFEPTLKEPLSQQLPSQLFSLTNWKLTLPIASPDNPEQPLEIRQPELATYQAIPWFKMTSDKKGVIFRAPVNSPSTANSEYPRSELREMTADGKEELFWSSTKGIHTLLLEEAITAVPKNKPDVVAGQIHGDDDDIIVVRLEEKKLFLARSKEELVILDDAYTLGKRFTIKFVAKNGEIATYYNNNLAPAYTFIKKVNQAYFKVGVYTQSNCETEESPDLCLDNNYGEVVIYNAQVTHE
jgi:hypothetical protein